MRKPLAAATTLPILGLCVAWGLAVSRTSPSGVEELLGEPRSFTFNYSFTVENIPEDAKHVKVWIPVPQTDEQQTVSGIHASDGIHFETVSDEEYHNQFLCFDLVDHVDEGSDATATVSYRVNRRPYRRLAGSSPGEEPRDAELARFLKPDRLVPVSGAIIIEAMAVTQNESEPLGKARALYDHIVETVRYDKSGEGWGRGDAAYACDARAGNCTDFHSLFIGEARSLGIPARFIMGFPLPEDASEGPVSGYHCWAEFYVRDLGWVPIDASEAHKHPQKHKALFGGLDANRVAVSVGRDIQLPRTAAMPLNYVIYPYVEVDGKPHADVTTRFSFSNAQEG